MLSPRLGCFGSNCEPSNYTCDARGNRISINRNGAITSATFDSDDKILTQGDLRCTYTDNSDLLEKENIVTGQKITLTYDQRGQLTRAILNSARTISYGIDAEGHRLTRSIDGVLQAGYLHDVSGRLVAEVEPSGALRSHFVYASQGHSPDYMIRGTQLYYFAKDNLGSIKAVIDASSGTVAQAIHYDEFGRVLVNTNPGFQPFGFAGGHFDHETGLVRFGARDYDPELGRWTARDPILFNGRQSNLYLYTYNDPVNFIDPTGRSGVAGATVGLISGAIGGYVTGGFWGAVVGAAAGALVGAVVPAASGEVGAFAGGIASSLIGQVLGNAISDQPYFKLDPLLALASGFGGSTAFLGTRAAAAGGMCGIGIESGIATGADLLFTVPTSVVTPGPIDFGGLK